VTRRAVLYVANSSKIGGGNRSLISLIEQLDGRRFAPALVLPARGPMVEWAAAKGVPYEIVTGDDWGGRAELLSRAFGMMRVAHSAQVSIIHTMAPTCYRAAALVGRLLRAPRVCHLGFPPEAGEILRSFWSGPEAVVGCFDGQTEPLEDDIRRRSPHCRIVDIPNGIDLDRFRAARERRAGARARLGIADDPLVLIVGHLSEVKGHPVFLRAAAEVSRRVPNCQFAALGGETIADGYGTTLRELAGSLGLTRRMHFLGWRDDVPDVLAAADIVVLPSWSEGLPLAVLEAMACARPVVATPVGGVARAVVHGVTGLFVQPGDHDQVAAAVCTLLENPQMAEAMGTEARRLAETRYSLDAFTGSIQSLYDELLTTKALGVGLSALGAEGLRRRA
jgi:glycosyltransferase involved in cell wall biosynthesis